MNNAIKGNIVDIIAKRIYPAEMIFNDGIITSITELNEQVSGYILPGFIDAHVHIESSMIIPTEFSRLCLPHGTLATVSDPHEIANVLGMDGIEFMIENSKLTPLEIVFGAPSCVPATTFETAGATIDCDDIAYLLNLPEIGYLSEMMNYPGVLHNDTTVMKKLSIARAARKPIDGHAPGLRGLEAKQYAQAGITTDHECTTLEEALEKIHYGMKILIREGSAAKNFNALHPLLSNYADSCMFCSDDKHPDDLVQGHINECVNRALSLGYDLFDVLKVAHLNPKQHYSIQIGTLQIGDSADFIISNDIQQIDVHTSYVKGICIARNGAITIDLPEFPLQEMSICNASFIEPHDLSIPKHSSTVRIIRCVPGELITHEEIITMKSTDDYLHADINSDIIKIVNVNRYKPSKPALGFVKGIGLQHGAIASTIAHDSHNIIAIGADDISLTNAINALIENKGGICYVHGSEKTILHLDIAGLMSSQNAHVIAQSYEKIDRLVKNNGSNIHAPFMTLSFLGLLVIPSLKLSDKGLFNGDTFSFTPLHIS